MEESLELRSRAFVYLDHVSGYQFSWGTTSALEWRFSERDLCVCKPGTPTWPPSIVIFSEEERKRHFAEQQ
jgi:hypothetical protein